MVSHSENNEESLSTLVENPSFSPNRNGLAEKGFLGGLLDPLLEANVKVFPIHPHQQPNLGWAIHGYSIPEIHCSSDLSTQQVHMTRLVWISQIVIFCQASTAQKPTIALFKRHYGPGRTRICSPMCTLGPGASKWYSVLGNLPSFSKLPHGGLSSYRHNNKGTIIDYNASS